MRNILIIGVVISILTVLFTGCGGGGGSAGVTLTGSVVNGATGAPLAGVRVALGSKSTTTAADGTFTLTGLTIGSAVLTAQLTGYEISSRQVTLTAGINALSAPIQMAPTTGQPPNLTPRTIQGTITLTGESNASGVTITLLSGTTTYDSMTTGSDGNYYFWAPTGVYKLLAAKAGFVTKEQTVTVSDMAKVVTVNLTLLRQ